MDDNSTRILKKFFGKERLSFTQLKGDLPSNKASYYLGRLVEDNYLEKKNGFYYITSAGEKFLTYLDKKHSKTIRQPIENILIFPMKGKKILLQRRKRRPFLNCIGPIGAKRVFSESVLSTVKRKLFEDTGLEGKAKFKGTLEARMFKGENIHLHYTSFMFKVTNLGGEFKKSVPKGENYWLTEKEFFAKKNIMTGMDYHFTQIKKREASFVELNQYLDKKGRFLKAEKVN